MRRASEVSGYLRTEIAEGLKANTKGLVHLSPERGLNGFELQVQGLDIKEVRMGDISAGETLVHLVLREGATVHIVIDPKFRPI